MARSQRRTRPSLLRWPLAPIFLLLFVGSDWASDLPEYDIKAAYLFNFAKFVEWPTRAFPSPSAPLVIGLLGSDPFGGRLDRITQGEVIHGHQLCRTVGELKGCQMVFIPKTQSDRVGEALAAVRGTGALTVGDSDGFVAQGGMIGFVTTGNTVRFHIDAAAAQREDLAISSRLLKLGV
jgi:hypothetical protein